MNEYESVRHCEAFKSYVCKAKAVAISCYGERIWLKLIVCKHWDHDGSGYN